MEQNSTSPNHLTRTFSKRLYSNYKREFKWEQRLHRGDPLNEETDIRSEMGRHREQKEVIWDSPTNRTVYQWIVRPTTTSSTWTNTVRNRFRQKVGEIEAFRALEIGVVKWCKEHIPRKGNNLTDEGISLLVDMELSVVGKTKSFMAAS